MSSNNYSSGTNKPSLNIVRLSEVEAKPIRWLWPNFIPKGKLSLIVGHPGQGKSTLTAEIAAIVSRGGPWPVSGVKADIGEVIFLSSEDDIQDTIKPRMMAANADHSKVRFIRSVAVSNNRNRPFYLKKDIEKLEDLEADLLVIDPITANLSGVDTHNNAEVREALELLRDFAERKDMAVLCVSHLNKSENSESISRVSGSMAFTAVPRAVHILIPDPDSPSRRLLFPLKGNLGPNQDCYAFSIESRLLAGAIHTSAIVWEDDYAPIPIGWGPQDKPKTALERAKEFLRELLGEKPYPVTEIEKLGKSAGHSWATIRRAKDGLGIVSRKTDWEGGHVWCFPDATIEDAQDAEDAQDEDASLMSTFEKTEHLREVNGRS